MEIKGIFSYLTVNNNKYIFGIEKESIDFAIRLLEKGIDFAGFLYDGYDDLKLSDSCRPSIFNKKVYMLNEITMLDSSVIISSCFQKK
ncbi:hypothetical protein UYO_3130 [Lachnospiraceae bacterium JC7]|nr:hypothetical protein UYO_3130 [Lachnospiraceae bacterium JC7]